MNETNSLANYISHIMDIISSYGAENWQQPKSQGTT